MPLRKAKTKKIIKSKKLKKGKVKNKRKVKSETSKSQKYEVLHNTELNLSTINSQACSMKWSPHLHSAEKEELKADLSEFKKCFNLTLEAKSKQIDFLKDEITKGVDQRRSLNSSYLSGIEKLIGIFQNRSTTILDNFGNVAATNLEDIRREETKQMLKLQEDDEFFKTLSSAQQGEVSDGFLGKLKKDFANRILDMESLHYTSVERITMETDDKIEWLLLKLQTDLKTKKYLMRASPYCDFDELQKRDDALMKIIVQQQKQEEKLKGELLKLRAKLHSNDFAAKVDKEAVFRRVLKAQQKFKCDMAYDRNVLRAASVAAEAAIQHLSCVWRQVKLITDVHELCADKSRKLVLKRVQAATCVGSTTSEEQIATLPKLEIERAALVESRMKMREQQEEKQRLIQALRSFFTSFYG